MDRRFLIKQLVLVTSGTLLLPSCLRPLKDSVTKYTNFDLTQAQLELMAGLSETVLPLSQTPQANQEKLHLFVVKMVDECMPAQEQQRFVAGITALQQLAEKKHGSSNLPSDEQIKLVTELENAEFEGDIAEFYRIFKSQLINGYLNSAYFMKNVIEYKLIPGSYSVHVSV